LSEAIRRLLTITGDEPTQGRCRKVAEGVFSLDSGVDAYEGIYRSLAELRAGTA
jgi:hypothetical protein